jgi:hypothetical protein
MPGWKSQDEVPRLDQRAQISGAPKCAFHHPQRMEEKESLTMLRAKLLAVSTAAGLGLAFFAPQAQAILDNNNITVIESCSGNTSSFDDDHANHQGGDGDRANVDNSDSQGSRNCSFIGGYEGLNGLPSLPGGDLPVDPTSLIPGGLPGDDDLPPLPVDPADVLADPAGFLAGVPGMLPPPPVNPEEVLADVLGVIYSTPLPSLKVEAHAFGIDVLVDGNLVIPSL